MCTFAPMEKQNVNRLIEANLGFVVSIARQYLGRGLQLDDLVSEGNMGLIKAAQNYDEQRGVPFPNYAVVHIRQHIEKALDKEGQERRVEARRDGQTRSVDAPLGAKPNISLLSVLADKDTVPTDERTYNAAVAQAVQKALESLDERERQVVTAFYGMLGDSLTMAEIADDMGLKRERVRQIRDRAVRRLKKAYRQELKEMRERDTER